jgi:exonuclease SbcD
VRDAAPDAVVIAGDIYDRSVPPPEAVRLFDDVLSRLVLDLKVPVILIAGNHDSPQRVGFASKLLSQRDVHIFGPFTAEIGVVTLGDKDGPVHFHAIPYADPATVRSGFDRPDVVCHDSAMRCCVKRIRDREREGRKVLIAHQFVVGGTESDSERPLSVGGAGTVGADVFDGFNYVALGHLHRPQSMSGGKVCYSGSLMKYSFSEADHSKSVSIVEMDGSGVCKVERVTLSPRRDVRIVKGLLADILKGPLNGESKDDYIEAILDDTTALLEPRARLREVYPNTLKISRSEFEPQVRPGGRRVDHTKLNDLDLFGAFFHQVTGDAMVADQSKAFTEVVEALRRQERESKA